MLLLMALLIVIICLVLAYREGFHTMSSQEMAKARQDFCNSFKTKQECGNAHNFDLGVGNICAWINDKCYVPI